MHKSISLDSDQLMGGQNNECLVIDGCLKGLFLLSVVIVVYSIS